MASIARASLHRNNQLANRLPRLSQQPLSAGKAPRGNGVVVSLCRSLHSTSIVGGGARPPDNCPLPPQLRDKLCPLIGKGIRKIDLKFDEEDDQDNEEEKNKTYMAGVGLSPICIHNVSEVDAEMKDGVLKVIIPNFKDEERTDFKYIPIN